MTRAFLIETEGLNGIEGLVSRLLYIAASLELAMAARLLQEGLWLCMKGNISDQVDEYRAAVLLGMPQSELRRYSRASGLGHVESDGKGQKVVFMYEELRRICLLVTQSSK